MNYFEIEPEVAGSWGENTDADVSVHPPRVRNLHYKFDGWLGDSILESFPCFIVTSVAAAELEINNLKGFRLAPVEISTSETYREIYGDKKLPPFKWLQVDGEAGTQDFGLHDNNILVVSCLALEILQKIGIKNCEIKEWHG
jgi:hypothetical protein